MDRRDATRRITYSAVCTAIAVTVILISHFSPMRIVPLILASLAFYIAFVRCGALYGIVTVAVSVLICFFVSGINTTFLFLCIWYNINRKRPLCLRKAVILCLLQRENGDFS